MVRAMRTLMALAFILAACGGSSTPAQPKPAAERIAGTGNYSEEEFKALHTLSGEAAPAPKGETIDLAGSKAYLSLPEGATGPVPGIVVIHEWWGLNDHIRHWSDRLAALGYAAVAVDLYGGTVATDRDTAMAAMKAVDEARAKEILAAAVDFLASDPRIQAPKRGVIGWCFGGGWSFETALTHPELDAAVVYYGQVPTTAAEVEKLDTPVLGIFASNDEGIDAAGFEKALTEAGKPATIQIYEADHAFANPSGDRYDQEDATAAWAEVVAFFEKQLGPT
jgi:carboxymethylenebutenolidase